MRESKRVLVIGDPGKNVDDLVGLLARTGFDALSLTRPMEALNGVKSLQPDLILLDYDPREISGPELAVLLRSDGKTRDIPIVMVSEAADPERILIAALSGARGFVRTPLDPKRLLDAMEPLFYREPSGRPAKRENSRSGDPGDPPAARVQAGGTNASSTEAATRK